MHHLRAAIVRASEDRGQILIVARPGGREDGRLVFQDLLDTLLRRVQEQVDPDRLCRDRTRLRDHCCDLVRRNERRADNAETAGLGDGTDEFTARVAAAHPRRNDGVVDTKKDGERGADHEPSSLASSARAGRSTRHSHSARGNA